MVTKIGRPFEHRKTTESPNMAASIDLRSKGQYLGIVTLVSVHTESCDEKLNMRISYDAKLRLVGYVQAGRRRQDIAREFGVSTRTVQRAFDKFIATNSVKDLPRSGDHVQLLREKMPSS